jgi:hypothetical protein
MNKHLKTQKHAANLQARNNPTPKPTKKKLSREDQEVEEILKRVSKERKERKRRGESTCQRSCPEPSPTHPFFSNLAIYLHRETYGPQERTVREIFHRTNGIPWDQFRKSRTIVEFHSFKISKPAI